VERPSN
jgi:hypothetical protein